MTLFSDTEVWMLNDEQLTSAVVEAFRAKAQAEERCARLAGAAEDRDLPRLSGTASTGAWVANLTKVSTYEAARTVRRAEAMGSDVEDTRRAWAAGDLNGEQAEVIASAVTGLPDRVGFEERALAQKELLDVADRFNLHDLKRAANHILELIDPEGAEAHLGSKLDAEEKRSWLKTSFSMHSAGEGMVRGRFILPSVQAGMLKTALEGLASPRRNSPGIYDRDGEHSEAANGTLTHDQKLGRAFCELIEHLPTDAMPQHGGLAASITVNVDLQKLHDLIGTATLSTGDEMSASQARRFACNANLIPVVLDGDSRILDLGVAQRIYNRYQRIALAKRDYGCCWKGCDRPPAWCESHHLVWHSRGGPTTIANGALFCFYHHHLLHEGEWDARMGADGVVEVIPPARVDPQRRPMRHTRFRSVRAGP